MYNRDLKTQQPKKENHLSEVHTHAGGIFCIIITPQETQSPTIDTQKKRASFSEVHTHAGGVFCTTTTTPIITATGAENTTAKKREPSFLRYVLTLAVYIVAVVVKQATLYF